MPINRAYPEDFPSRFQPTRVLIYAAGLKIYGMIPHLLAKRLSAEFHSRVVGAITLPSAERNFTFVPYRRPDGSRHSQAAIDALVDFLRQGGGFEMALAEGEEFHNPLDSNFLQDRARFYVPDDLSRLMMLLLGEGG